MTLPSLCFYVPRQRIIVGYYLKQFRKDAQAALQDAVYLGD